MGITSKILKKCYIKKEIKINIHETTVNINSIKIFGVNDLKIGRDYLIIKENDNNLIHFTDHSKEENPYFTIDRHRY